MVSDSILNPEALRSAHASEEAYVKAVGAVNYFYAILLGLGAAYFICITVLHVSGSIGAAWSVRPGWLAFQADLCLTAIVALIAGVGLRHLTPWALGAESLFVLCLVALLPLGTFAYSKRLGIADLAGGVALVMAFLAPLIKLWDVRKSILFSKAYHRAVESTPETSVRGKVPWELTLSAIGFFVLYLLIGALGGFTE